LRMKTIQTLTQLREISPKKGLFSAFKNNYFYKFKHITF